MKSSIPSPAKSAPPATTRRAPNRPWRRPANGEIEHEAHHHRQPRHAGLERREALDVLEVQRDEKEESGQSGIHQAEVEIRDREGPAPEEVQREHRLGVPRLEDQEGRPERHGGAEEGKRERRRPGVVIGLDETQGQAEERPRGESGPAEIEPAGARIARLANLSERRKQARDADRNVHPEDRRPVEDLDQRASEHGTEGEPEAGDRCPDPDRPRPPLWLERIYRIESDCGARSAAPMPCSARNAISIWSLVESAQPAEKSVKRANPRTKTRLRP